MIPSGLFPTIIISLPPETPPDAETHSYPFCSCGLALSLPLMATLNVVRESFKEKSMATST